MGIAGYSLGGATASIIAACAANGYTGFPVHGLYTFGAPAVSKDQLTGPGGDCLPGRRIYIDSYLGVDPVPWVLKIMHFAHPRVEAQNVYPTRLFRASLAQTSENKDSSQWADILNPCYFNGCSNTRFECESTASEWGQRESWSEDNILLHFLDPYINMLESAKGT